MMDDFTLLQRFADLFDEIPVDTKEEADEILREAGLDPASIGKEFVSFVHELLKEGAEHDNSAKH